MSETNKWQIQTFSSGVAYDSDVELTFSKDGSGFFVDGHNVEVTSNDGNTGAVQKIKGEVLLHDNTTGATGYKCVGSWQVGPYLTEFWGPNNPSFPGICRVNGTIVLSSTNFTLLSTRPLQGDKNEADGFYEVYPTDNFQPPFIFNVKDMVDSLTGDPDKYFSNFDPKSHQINIQSALDHPVFVELVKVGGGGGKPVGKYMYQIRYANQSGDRTQWSHPTPPIPVPRSLSSDSKLYPWTKTYGSAANPSSKTGLAPKIRFRVTNLYDYDYIEVRCVEYNGGAGIEFSPNGKIVARIDVSPGEIGIREYIDPAESNVDIALSPESESRELAYVERCKSARYVDRRLVLMNVTVPSREANVDFRQENEKEGWPVIEKLYIEGHKDPWNDVYRRSEMRGEKSGFGVVFYDSVGNKSFVEQPDQLKNYQFPNRRDPVAQETYDYSFGRCVKAANTTVSGIGYTHEVFDLPFKRKSGLCQFKNIVHDGGVAGLTGTKTATSSGVNGECDETNAQIENYGANVSGFGALVSTSYHPFHPTSQNDPDVTGHDYIVNPRVAVADPPLLSRTPSSEDERINRPAGFNPNYYSMGIMMAGVQNIPDWAKSFAVVKTESAKRVVAQGIGYYSLIKGAFKLIGNESLGGKELTQIAFFSPDIENGTISSDFVNDLIANPGEYKLQFVSPLGFFSEWYSAEDNLVANKRDRCIDMISYVRMVRDQKESPFQLNPGEDMNMGIIDGIDDFQYVGYEQFRNLTASSSAFSSHADKGNRLFTISAAARVSEGRGTYINIRTTEAFYATPFTGGNGDANFANTGLKNWTEPVYIVNIIRTGAQINDTEAQKYRQTSHYQKVESIIGKSNGEGGQSFLLVDERWEDCIPAPNSGEYGYTTERYVYIKLPNGEVQKWVNVTYMDAVARSNITAKIAAGTTDIKGLYTHTNISGKGRFFSINFNISGYVPPVESLILVRYDETAPIRAFGGDTYISEAIFAPIDGASNADDDAAETQFCFGIGLPYKNFKINPRYYTIRKAGATFNQIQDSEWFTLGFIRQLCVMFACETRSGLHLAYNASSDLSFFPNTHYIIRPNRWSPEDGYEDNSIFKEYGESYGAEEIDKWKWGGFRFLQQVNPDYAVKAPIMFFSKPKFGFTEKKHYPNMSMWSLQRGINVQNAPGLRTFPANNSYTIEDDTGEIKYGYDCNSDRGDNIYAFTDKGIALLVTRKTVLSDLDGGQLGYMASGQFITNRLWISKEVGMTDEMWRGSAEASVPITLENGSQARRDAIFFPNKTSIFRMINNDVVDIGRINYHSKIRPILSAVASGVNTQMAGVFDNLKQQYYALIGTTTFVFSQQNNHWFGTNDFSFDRFTTYYNRTFGHRDLKVFELNVGYSINGGPVTCKLRAGFSPELPWEKEYVRIRINSSSKPTSVSFYKEKNGISQCIMNSASQGPLYLKNYGGWSQFIPRVSAFVSSGRARLQCRAIIADVVHSEGSEFVLKDIYIEYKPLIIQ